MSTQIPRAADEQYMKECFRLARKGAGFVSPNPLVGAVLVRSGTIVARGYHRNLGGPHAEVNCLRNYKGNLRSATLYVNLEPCSHHGKTPPCADTIARSGIRRVVIAMKDPNPLVAGRGIRRMRRAGIHVTVGLLEDEALELNRMFCRHIVLRRPYVHLKIAQSLDGRISRPGGGGGWISSQVSRAHVHRLRSEYDAVLVGAGTIRSDDPLLTVRMTPGRNPDVVILDGKFTVPSGAAVFRNTHSRRCFVCIDALAEEKQIRKVQYLTAHGVHILRFNGEAMVLRIKDVLRELYRRNIGSVLVEGGSRVFGQCIHEGMMDELTIFVAPAVLGGGLSAFGEVPAQIPRGRRSRLDKIAIRNIGGDILIHALIH